MDKSGQKTGIDWSQEYAIAGEENFCGWCNGERGHTNCDGTCFDPSSTVCGNKAYQNRIEKARNEVARIPDQIKALQSRIQRFKQFLKENRM